MRYGNFYHQEKKEEQEQEGTPVKLREIKPGQFFAWKGHPQINKLLSVEGYFKIKRADDWIVTIEFHDPVLDKIVYLKLN